MIRQLETSLEMEVLKQLKTKLCEFHKLQLFSPKSKPINLYIYIQSLSLIRPSRNSSLCSRGSHRILMQLKRKTGPDFVGRGKNKKPFALFCLFLLSFSPIIPSSSVRHLPTRSHCDPKKIDNPISIAQISGESRLSYDDFIVPMTCCSKLLDLEPIIQSSPNSQPEDKRRVRSFFLSYFFRKVGRKLRKLAGRGIWTIGLGGFGGPLEDEGRRILQ